MAKRPVLTTEQIDVILKQQLPSNMAKVWSKDRSDEGVLGVLSDWLLEQGIDPEPVIAELKLVDDQRIRRENMEEVMREQGNLEHEPMLIQELTMEAPPVPRVNVVFSEGDMEIRFTAEVPADAPIRIVDEKWRKKGDPKAPRGSYMNDPMWQYVRDRLPFFVETVDIIRAAEKEAAKDPQQVPWVGLEGELFYPAGEPRRTWLYMEYAPEHLGRVDGDHITRYTDGGGFQSNAAPAFVDLKNDVLYQLVADGSINPEVECPFIEAWGAGAPEFRVEDEHTLYGENPHKSCRFCEAEIGEEHGVLYVGEGGEYIYAAVPDEREEEEDENPRRAGRAEDEYQGNTFVAAKAPLTGEAHTIDLLSTHVMDEDGHYVNPRNWRDASAVDWDLSDVDEADFGEEVGRIEIDGTELTVFRWEI